MARWINITKAPFDYRWPDRPAITAYREAGDHFVKDEVADFAIGKGYATEGKANASSRSTKGKTRRRRKEASPASTADTGPAKRVDNPGSADDDRTADRQSVDNDAGER